MTSKALSRIAIGQFCSSSDPSRNLILVTELISKAIDKGVRLIFFPEASDYISRDAPHSRKLAQETPRFVRDLQENIKSLSERSTKKIDVAIGVHMPPSSAEIAKGENRVKNILYYIDHHGEIVESYQKLHLFDVDVPNGPIIKESDSVQPGSKIPLVVDSPVGKLGLGICYDMRFPELSMVLRSRGAQVLCFPSAFTMRTGKAHWELLGRARAIDTQCFVVMPAQSGKHDVYADGNDSEVKSAVERVSWGNSMIINPWGDIIAHSNTNQGLSDPQLIIGDLDFSLLDTVRANMPLWEQRRNDPFK